MCTNRHPCIRSSIGTRSVKTQLTVALSRDTLIGTRLVVSISLARRPIAILCEIVQWRLKLIFEPDRHRRICLWTLIWGPHVISYCRNGASELCRGIATALHCFCNCCMHRFCIASIIPSSARTGLITAPVSALNLGAFDTDFLPSRPFELTI